MFSAWAISICRTKHGFYRTFTGKLSQARVLEQRPAVQIAPAPPQGSARAQAELLEQQLGRSKSTTSIIQNLAAVALYCDQLTEAKETPLLPYDLHASLTAGRQLRETFDLLGGVSLPVEAMQLPVRTAELYLRMTRRLLAGYKDAFAKEVANGEIVSGERRVGLDELGEIYSNRIITAAAGTGKRVVRQNCLELVWLYQEIAGLLEPSNFTWFAEQPTS